jgi:hypothetical protein
VSRARTHLWFDVVWPVATGLVTGLGLVAAFRWTGPLMFLVAFAVLEVTVAPVAWSLLTELGFGVQRIAWRVAPATAAGMLAVIGLADVIAAWTFLVIGLALITSPVLRGWRRGGLRGLLPGTAPGTVPGTVPPHWETRRRFDEIVAHGFGTPDEDPPRR